MFRAAIVFLIFLGMAPFSLAEERKPGDPVPLLLSGAQMPTPSLKYRLAHDRRDLVPGNAATLYYRTHAILYENSVLFKDIKQNYWYEWSEMPLEALPRAEVREKVNQARRLIIEAEFAGRRRDCDWQLDNRNEGFGLLLPEVQGYRGLATVMAVKVRLDMAEGRFAEALDTTRTGMTLGRNVAQGPSLIHVLVGVACTQVMLKQIEDMIQQPDSPNLYWALTAVPHPFIDARKGILDECEWLEDTLPFLKRLEGAPMSLDDVATATAIIRKMQGEFNLRRPSRVELLAQAAYIEAAHKEAKAALIKQGLKAELVEAMPSFQAVSLFAYREYRETREEVYKWIHVPEGRKHPAFLEAAKRHEKASDRLDRMFFSGLLRGLNGPVTPVFENVIQAANRLERHLAMLRCVEALRLYAARHGRWPSKLDAMKDVPVPIDPTTGKAFNYKMRDANNAVLTTPSPDGETLEPRFTYTYELALRK